MHIPDSVLSPATSAVTGAAMLPVWALAGRRVRQNLGARQAPLLALGAAFCFTIMLFNIPALGGTTAHPVAGTLLAVMIGPWAATIGMSVTLAIQALFFGDGGLLTYGANCFTMAFVLPFVGYSIYRLAAGRSAPNAPARALCAALGAYVGLNAAAAVVAVLLGVQPALFHKPNGEALYFPFGLKVTLPAMLGTHLLIAGPAEAVVTGLVVRYLQAAGIPLYGTASLAAGPRRRREALWIGLLALLALSPLGLLARGEAWGEWDVQGLAAQIEKTEGKVYVPEGAERAERHGYKGLRGLEDYASDDGKNRWGYVGAALLGVGAIVVLTLLGGRFLARRAEESNGGGAAGGNGEMEPGQPALTSRASPSPLPDWLQRPSEETAPSLELSGRPPNRFLERTLGELSASAATTLYGERWARQPGYLQRRDARAKVVAFLGLIGVVACVHNAVTLLCLYALTVGLAAASRLPVRLLAQRVWLSVPLFIGAVALPVALNVVTPGRALLVLWSRPYLALTAPGLQLAAMLLLRVGVAVTFATLLTLTTPWNDLLRALRALFVPRLFVGVLAMTYRYAAVLLHTAAEMFVARRSRTVGRATNAQGRGFLGAAIGALFGKALALSEEVHAAMIARGFQGEMRTLSVPRWKRADSVWILAMALAAVLALGGEYVPFFR
ncbi:MAG TPA: cobalt transporter CbiM [Chthonomonadaceae bacterium]|nr:cobalt transporter CbiM [Chthonomonadaceae bacterium]